MDEPSKGQQPVVGGGSAFGQFSPATSGSADDKTGDKAGSSAPALSEQASATASSVAGQVKDKAAEALGGQKRYWRSAARGAVVRKAAAGPVHRRLARRRVRARAVRQGGRRRPVCERSPVPAGVPR